MDSKDTQKVDKLFEQARKVPSRVSLEEVKSTLSQVEKTPTPFLIHLPSPRNSYEWGIAACILLLAGIAAVFFPGHPELPYDFRETQLTENTASPFMLLDTYQGEDISYWDTSQTPYPRLEAGMENIRCFQTYMEDTACYLTVALELGKPDFIKFALADLSGVVVSHLLTEGRQHQSDSSYNFDLCKLQSGKYDLLIETNQGDKLRKQIVLN